MGLTKAVLKRPVTTFLVLICLVVFGAQSILSSNLELMPPMDMPILIVNTLYPGASPEDVTDLVTKEIEDEIGALPGIDTISSTSMENMSLVILQYEYGTDMDEAYDELRKKVDAVQRNLPEDAQEPGIMEINLNDQATMSLSINHKTDPDLYTYVKNRIVPEFEKISTITEVNVSGGNDSYIKIQLEPETMEQYNLNMGSITQAISGASFTYPTGRTISGDQDLSVSAGTEYDTLELLKEIPIILNSGDVITLDDVSDIGTVYEEKSSIARYNGEETISININKQQSATAGEVSEDASYVIQQLMAQDPNLEIITVNDSSNSINESLMSVVQTMLLAIVVAMIIIFLFFGEFKASIIVGTSIPVSILVALIFMRIFGFTLNLVTLSSLVLGVGMMVDNSIVVLESCFRATKGKGFVEYNASAIEGSGNVLQSVVASTITTCVVFVPLALLQGMSGMMFKPLGFTIVFCMVASLISAITLVPLFYCLYRPVEKETAPLSGMIAKLQDGYRKIMAKILPNRFTVLFISVFLLVISILMATRLRMELIPADDTGSINISVEMKPGLLVEEVDKVLMEVEKIIVTDPDLDSYLLSSGGGGLSSFGSGGSTGSVTAYLLEERSRETDEIAKEWEGQFQKITNANVTVSAGSSVGMSSGSDVEYILEGTQYDDIKLASDRIVEELLMEAEINKVSSTLENAAPVVELDIDTIKANAKGVAPIQVAMAVNEYIEGTEATTLEVDGEEVSVMVEYPEGLYESVDQLSGIMISTNRGSKVALTDVATIGYKDSPVSIERANKQYQVTISADVQSDDPRVKQEIEDRLFEKIVKNHMTQSMSIAQNASDQAMIEEFTSLGTAIVTAVFLIFVVMAAQFESPKFSTMVMTTIPFALIGSFGLLYITDVAISMPSLLGFLMLVGTVVNNGILYVDTVNMYKVDMDLHTALIEAGAIRLRPILMTTLTTIVAMIPMSFAWGDAGETLQGLALVNVGGLIASTVLALLMLPVYYLLLTKKAKKEVDYD